MSRFRWEAVAQTARTDILAEETCRELRFPRKRSGAVVIALFWIGVGVRFTTAGSDVFMPHRALVEPAWPEQVGNPEAATASFGALTATAPERSGASNVTMIKLAPKDLDLSILSYPLRKGIH